MASTDPTDTGGLFIGRRPGTRPVVYKDTPEYAGEARQRRDRLLAALILAFMVFVNLLFWGPLPLGWLWVASQIDYQTGSTFLGITVAFFGLLVTLMVALSLLWRIDRFWILVRRAAGFDQRSGMIGRVFAYSAVVGVTIFSIWLLLFAGLGPSLAPNS
jgi:hypothetical protein